MRSTPKILALTLLVVAATAAGPASAAGKGKAERANAALSLDEAVAQVRQDTRGRILGGESRNDDGRVVHYIKVLLGDGRVRMIRVDGGRER